MSDVSELDAVDRKLLNEMQREVPAAERPFLILADRIGTSEEDVLGRVRRMKDGKVIRQILSIFDTPALGYRGMLAAFRVPPERIEAVAEVVNAHPGVSHDYERDHAYNLWFTIAVPPGADLEGDVRTLARIAEVKDFLFLPTLKLYKIGVRLDMSDGGGAPKEADADEYFKGSDRGNGTAALTETEVRLVRCLQDDLPVVARPYEELGRRWGFAEREVIQAARGFLERALIRRTAAILRHRRAGFGANGMGVWSVPEPRWDEVGEAMAAFRAVSHCYRRPTGPGWPYTHFTMIHGKTQEEVKGVVGEIAQKTGVADHFVLFSTREFKKTRLKFFTDDYARWRESHPAV